MTDFLLTTKMMIQHSDRPILFMGQNEGASVTFEEYQSDFNDISLARESKRMFFNHQSRQLPYRRYLIDYIRISCQDKGLSIACVHLATYFMDMYMDYHQINVRRLTLVAIASLMMAAKVEENKSNVPNLKDLMPLRNEEVKKCFSELESAMLAFFKFDLLIPTAAHHVPYYMQALLTEEELSRPGSENIIDDMCTNLENNLDIILYDVHILQGNSPAKVAAALIAACRIRHGFSAWNPDLTKISKQNPEEFEDILDRILHGTSASLTKPQCMNCYNEIEYN